MLPNSLALRLRTFSRSFLRIAKARQVLVLGAWCAMGTCLQSPAQNVILTGGISGRVTDESGAVMPHAVIVAQNLDNSVDQTTISTHAGLYQFPVLKPGTYSVAASLKGFREERVLVRVSVGNTTSQDFKLLVGTSPDVVKIEAKTPLLRPEESSASSIVDRNLINGLPLNGRKYTEFVTLTPNTSYDGDTGLVGIDGQQGGEDSGYANGNGATIFTVDGSNATNNYFSDIIGRYRVPYLYGENSIQEFQVDASAYSAVYGGGSGFVNSVTRSGTNVFHGNAFYYNRNSATGANDALDKAAGFPRPDDSLQQFGAGVGGPILRNKLWFFTDYEQQSRNFPAAVINPALSSNQPGFLSQNFGIPDGTPLPPPNGPLPIPSVDTVPGMDPAYLQQVSNAINALDLNLGTKGRKGNDWVVTPRLDFQPTSRDSLFLTVNVNHFNSPGGVITDPTVGNYGLQTLANAKVRTFQTSVGWTHTFSPRLLNEFHASTSQDSELSTPTGLAPLSSSPTGLMPTVILDSPASFNMGNAAFSLGRVFERQYSFSDRVDYVIGKHTLQFGFDWTRSYDSDTQDGGADPNEAVDFGSPLGLYEFPSLEAFALGEYNNFSQAVGNPTFSFTVPYYGFYVQDTYRILPKVTLEMGLREDFQVYPQPAENPAFPLTGQYPNQFNRVAPRFGVAWQPLAKTVVRGGFGKFYENMNGLNYRNAVISNGLPSQQTEASSSYSSGAPNNPQNTYPVFPQVLLPSDPLFGASTDISLVSPQVRSPYILQASLEIERELDENTTLTLGTIWSHGVHLLAGSAYDANLCPLQGTRSGACPNLGTTTYYVCPPNTTTFPCSGASYTLPNMDSAALAEGYINPNLGEINELISPGQNHYNSLFVQLQHRMSHGLALQFAYTWAKDIQLDGVDFNNQFDFSNTHAPSLLDQRHKLTLAAIYDPHLEQWARSGSARAIASGWRLNTILEFSSGRPYAGLLGPSPSGSNLNDTAFNQDTANTAAGINQAGPTPGIGLNSFYGPWLERIDLGLGRVFKITEGKELEFQAQAFNLLNHANYFVQNGGGVNQIQYTPNSAPSGPQCGDGSQASQVCYLVPNTGPGNFGTLQEISPNGLPRVLQFSARFTF
jgi:Carboxypeptidase regulatory-like domain/TonB dependent receptor